MVTQTDLNCISQIHPGQPLLDLKNRRKPGGTAPYAEDDLGYKHDPVSIIFNVSPPFIVFEIFNQNEETRHVI